MNNDFELLLAKDYDTYYEIIGITYSNAMQVDPSCKILRASLYAIEACKKALKDGKKITISKTQEYAEILPQDLIINEQDELSRHKKMAINEIAALMHQSLITVSVIDLMEYLNNYVNLLNAGYYITDSNREDKYFEIIEASQSCEEPAQLNDNATFEQEQEYIQKKQKYDNAQANLNTLEKYLNSYDKLSHLKSITSFLTDAREKIENCETIEDIEINMKIFKSNLKNYNIVNVS